MYATVGEMVKSNGLIEYKGGRVITKIMNVHIPYIEFVSIGVIG